MIGMRSIPYELYIIFLSLSLYNIKEDKNLSLDNKKGLIAIICENRDETLEYNSLGKDIIHIIL